MDRSPRGIEQLVEAQVRRYLASQEATGGAAATAAATTTRAPITISREYGALGEQLARMVADKLGYTCWDTELLHLLAQHTQAPLRLVEALDEHRRTGIERFVEMWTPSGAPSDDVYHRELVRVVRAIGAQGAAVIVGRGAQVILAPEEALHVRVIAPLEQRVAGLVARRGWTESQARYEIQRTDDDRIAFLRAGFGRDPRDVQLYDLVVNVGRLPLERAALVIEAAWRAKFSPA